MILLSLWYKVFPGVYAGLFKRTLRSICLSRTKGSQIAVLCIQTICKLLQTCLGNDNNDIQHQQQNDTTTTIIRTVSDTVQILQKLANDKNITVTSTKQEEESNETIIFFQKVVERVPPTLIILINLLTTARSSTIREQAVVLNRIVLLDTSLCWKRASNNNNKVDDLTTKAVESCLILSSCDDDNDDVASNAHRLIEEFVSTTMTGYDIGQSIMPRMIGLIESLPLLVQRQRDSELQTTLKLIHGYLTMNIKGKKTNKLLRTSLCSESSFRIIRKTLSFILDIDFGHNNNTIADQKTSLIVVISQTDLLPQQSFTPVMRFLNNDSYKLVVKMIRTLGRVLGHKHSSVYIDECIADIYDAFIERAGNTINNSKQSFVGHSQVSWLHDRVGAILLVQEILLGAFDLDSKKDIPLSSKEETKRLRWLQTIAKSILPLITCHHIWDLPIASIEHLRNVEVTKQARMDNLLKNDQSSTSASVAASHRCNAIMITLLLDLIRIIFILLDSEGKPFISSVLFPIVEKTSSLNPLMIQQKALSTLDQIAGICQFATVSELLAENIGILTGSILGRLRLPGGRNLSLREDLTDTVIFSVVSATSLCNLLCTAKGMKCENPNSLLSLLFSFEDLTYEFMAHFDHNSTGMKDIETIPILFLGLFDAAIFLVLCAYEACDKKTQSISDESLKGIDEPWFELIAEFRKNSRLHLSPGNGFADFTAEKSRDDNVTDSSQPSNNRSFSRDQLKRDTAFVAKIAFRCCYMLSYPSLRVQLKTCDVLTKCFSFLGWIFSDKSFTSDEANGPKTAILRLVATSWPSFSSRFKATTAALTNSNQTNLTLMGSHRVRHSRPCNIGEQRVYLSKLYELLSVMTECAEDFMATRFRQAVFPCMVQILGSFMGQRHRFSDVTARVDSLTTFSTQSLMNSEKILLLAICKCMKRVFGHRPAGESLSGLIPSAGKIIIPFLEVNDEEIVTNSMEALQSMLRIDCDALHCLLLEISNKNITPCPIRIRKSLVRSASKQNMKFSVNLAIKARELLDYIGSLPEQRLP